ncbi:hypothetical protein TNCV_5068771 [Trichonephila clavipes]|nr:hypothetical protein TNCV_5068771 [Trichonephila clavipes]
MYGNEVMSRQRACRRCSMFRERKTLLKMNFDAAISPHPEIKFSTAASAFPLFSTHFWNVISETMLRWSTLVNGERYRAMITNFFIPELNNQDVQELWFQQDGATCHTARATIDLLKPPNFTVWTCELASKIL